MNKYIVYGIALENCVCVCVCVCVVVVVVVIRRKGTGRSS